MILAERLGLLIFDIFIKRINIFLRRDIKVSLEIFVKETLTAVAHHFRNLKHSKFILSD